MNSTRGGYDFRDRAAATISAAESAIVSNQRIVILILCAVLVASLMGTAGLAYFFDNVVVGVMNIAKHIIAAFGYSAGTLLNTTANVASNATITTVEVADGAISSVGDIFRRANADGTDPRLRAEMDALLNVSQKPLLPSPQQQSASAPSPPPQNNNHDESIRKLREDLDRVINERKHSGGGGASAAAASNNAQSDDGSVSSIQKPITATKSSFCYLGTFEGQPGCVQVESGQRCMSGRLFDTRDQCMAHK